MSALSPNSRPGIFATCTLHNSPSFSPFRRNNPFKIEMNFLRLFHSLNSKKRLSDELKKILFMLFIQENKSCHDVWWVCVEYRSLFDFHSRLGLFYGFLCFTTPLMQRTWRKITQTAATSHQTGKKCKIKSSRGDFEQVKSTTLSVS